MHPHSPWAEWDPTQPGSLKPRPDDERVILKDDLVLILENKPGCVPDDLLREYLLRALRGELRRPKGRPPSKLSDNELTVVDIWVELEAKDIRAEREARITRHVRGELEPVKDAANRVARRFGNITGGHLLNQISAMKKRELNLKA